MSSPPRPLELTRLAADHLAEKGVEDARLEAELLLAHVLGLRRLDLYLQFERPLEPPEVDAYRDAIRRRAARMSDGVGMVLRSCIAQYRTLRYP